MRKLILLWALLVSVVLSSSALVAQIIGPEPHGIIEVAQIIGPEPHVVANEDMT